MAPNMMAFPVAMLGVLRAGGVQVNVNPMYTPRELEHQLNDAGLDDLLDIGLPSPPTDAGLKSPIAFVDALSAGSDMELSKVDLTGDDLIYLQYTGGTTGLSKGAMLMHRNLVANILQFESCAGDYIKLSTRFD